MNYNLNIPYFKPISSSEFANPDGRVVSAVYDITVVVGNEAGNLLSKTSETIQKVYYTF